MNIFKKIEKKINDFFEKTVNYTQKEGIIFIIIFLFMILFTIGIGAIFSMVWVKIGVIYLMTSFGAVMSLLETYNKFGEYVIIIWLLPYIILLMLIDKIYSKYIPYRGNDPMLIRADKVRYFKRRAQINRFKFWK